MAAMEKDRAARCVLTALHARPTRHAGAGEKIRQKDAVAAALAQRIGWEPTRLATTKSLALSLLLYNNNISIIIAIGITDNFIRVKTKSTISIAISI